jgi:hypothetical protein
MPGLRDFKDTYSDENDSLERIFPSKKASYRSLLALITAPTSCKFELENQ